MSRRLRLAARALALTLLSTSPPLAAALWPAPAMAQDDPYKLHMENGAKLFHDGNFAAALAEFQAAYDAKPSANPLVNVALCEKALFRYPRAIAALEKAIKLHGDAMDAGVKKDAEDAIREMRALLGAVTITVTPPEATVTVDGEEQPAGTAGHAIQLGPGEHKIGAKAPGFTPDEQRLVVASGQKHEIRIALVAEQGLVSIAASDPHLSITVDDRVVGTGSWSGTLPAGPHVVKAIGQGGPFESPIVVSTDKPVELKLGPPPKKEDPAQRRGLYVLATGSILFPLEHLPDFQRPHTDFGAAFGARVGFQVNNVAGFDLSYEHSAITTYQASSNDSNESYRLLSDRVAASLRLISPGKMWRFVGTLGGGFVVDSVQFGTDFTRACAALTLQDCPYVTPSNPPTVLGFDAYGLVEVGAELDIDRVLIDLGMEAQFESTGNITPTSTTTSNSSVLEGSIYGTRPIINIGPALRIGYRFW